MKPRQPSAPWTWEDKFVWASVLSRETLSMNFSFDAYLDSDRRDADLMLSFMRFRDLSQSWEQWHIRLASIGIGLEELETAWGA